MEMVFTQEGTFQAMWAAEQWCRDNGVSFGSSCVSGPVGLLRGDYCIAKWHNLSAKERAQLDGTMSGDMRNGPVTIRLRDLPQNVKWTANLQGLSGR
jgi:hypothetical protein